MKDLIIKSFDEIIETRTQSIWKEDDIIRCVNKTVNKHDLDDAVANVEAADRLSDGTPYLLMVDIRSSKDITIAARKYYISQKNKNVKAYAFVIDSPVSLMIGKMFMGINKPSFPLELMRDEAEAKIWLKSKQLV